MTKYTLLHCTPEAALEETGWLLVETKDIYDVVELNNDLDGTYILEESGELSLAYGYYRMDLIESAALRVAVRAQDLAGSDAARVVPVKAYTADGDEVEVYDIGATIAPSAKIVDVWRDIEHDTIIFDDENNDRADAWRSVWSGEATSTVTLEAPDIHDVGIITWNLDNGWTLDQIWDHLATHADRWEFRDFDESARLAEAEEKAYRVRIERHNCEVVELERFATFSEARAYIAIALQSMTLVDKDHECSDDVYNSGHVAHYEIMDSDSVTYDEDGDEVYHYPIYESVAFYNPD